MDSNDAGSSSQSEPQSSYANHRRNLKRKRGPGPGGLIVTLPAPDDRPTSTSSTPELQLLNTKCLSCKQRKTRCDGTRQGTIACVQCITLQRPCVWAVRKSLSMARAIAVYKTYQQSNSSQGGGDATQLLQPSQKRLKIPSGRSTQLSTDLSVSKQSPGLYVKSERKIKPICTSIPLAGWPAKNQHEDWEPPSSPTSEGSQAGHLAESYISDNQDGSEGTSSDDDSTSDEGLESEGFPSQASPLFRLSQSQRGTNFLTVNSYRSLLRTIFAEESSNLSTNIFWWEFSQVAKEKIRDKWTKIDYEKSASESYDVFLENALNWALWPRPASPHSDIADATGRLQCEFSAFLLDHLRKSSLASNVRVLARKAKLTSTVVADSEGIQQQSQPKPQALPSALHLFHKRAGKQSRQLDFNAQPVLLTEVESTGYAIGIQSSKAIANVLLRLAHMTGKEPARRLRKSYTSDIERQRSMTDDVDDTQQGFKAKEILSEHSESDLPSSSHSVEASPTKDPTPTHVIDPESDSIKLGGWKSVLQAACATKGFPKSAIAASIERLEGLYGSTQSDFLQDYGRPGKHLQTTPPKSKRLPRETVAKSQMVNVLSRPFPIQRKR